MTIERPRSVQPSTTPTPGAELPPPDIGAFIRYCHRRRGLGWPELYDEMCAVAARREFNGWDHDELERRGVTFSLFDMPRLAGWVRAILAEDSLASSEAPAVISQPALSAAAAV